MTRRRPLVFTALILLFCRNAKAQSRPAEPTTSPSETSEVPSVPGLSSLLRGVNAGLTISGLHDAVTGWATVAQPALSFSFNDRFALDITAPIYLYRLAESRAANPKPTALLVNQRGEPGDLIFAIHAQFAPRLVFYQATLSATAPTGDELYGLTSGRATFDLSNFLERPFRHVTPSLELGVGDNTTLTNRLVNKNYTSLGPLAHFQLAAAFPLPLRASFQLTAYEQLPIGDQKIYQSVRRGKTTTLVVSGHNVTEDNGLITSLDLPIDPHTTLSTYYSRSLRLHDDIVSFGITYVLRGAKRPAEDPDDDLLLYLDHPAAPLKTTP